MSKKDAEQGTLPLDEASIQERQVTIKVLTLGTKQVTQALYRQMVEDELIDESTGVLNGTVWGWVNLHIDCHEERPHQHVIWEEEGQLKRSTVILRSQRTEYHQVLTKDLEYMTKAYVGMVFLANKKFPSQEKEYIYIMVRNRSVKVKLTDNMQSFLYLPTSLKNDRAELERLQDPSAEKGSGYSSKQSQMEYLKRDIENWPDRVETYKNLVERDVAYTLKGHTSTPEKYEPYHENYARLYAEMEKTAEELNTIERNWEESRRIIEQQGQLFIAVSGVWK